MARTRRRFEIHQVLAVKGLNCPLPILRTKMALSRMQPGQVLHVLATDPHSVMDFRAFCARTGHELLDLVEGPEVFEFFIRHRRGERLARTAKSDE